MSSADAVGDEDRSASDQSLAFSFFWKDQQTAEDRLALYLRRSQDGTLPSRACSRKARGKRFIDDETIDVVPVVVPVDLMQSF